MYDLREKYKLITLSSKWQMHWYFSKLSLKAPELLKIIHRNKHVNNITSESTDQYQYKSCFFVLQCPISLKYKVYNFI